MLDQPQISWICEVCNFAGSVVFERTRYEVYKHREAHVCLVFLGRFGERGDNTTSRKVIEEAGRDNISTVFGLPLTLWVQAKELIWPSMHIVGNELVLGG